MTTKHTPKPWRAVIAFKEAFVNSEHMDKKIRVCNMPPIFNQADAHLIAAAPDLLAALKCALDYLNGWPADSQQRNCREAARAAIAKAEGR